MQVCDLIQNVISSLWIKSRRRLVKNQHFRTHCQNSCDRYSSFLTARELERRRFIIFFFQSYQFQCFQRTLFTLFFAQPLVFRSKAHICQYVNLEQLILRILEHQSYLITECTHIISILVNVLSIIIQRTVRCFHKSVQMLDQSRFPRSGMTDDSHKFTVWNLQANVFECMFFVCSPWTVYIIQMFYLNCNVCHFFSPFLTSNVLLL